MKKTTAMQKTLLGIVVFSVICSIALSGCIGQQPKNSIIVSTTTSLYDTGLLDVVEDSFESKSSINISFISAGTGIAIQHAQKGDADMILVHDLASELTFMRGGYGVDRKIIAYNFFAIVGPANDPAGIKNMTAKDAMAELAKDGRAGTIKWVSRGDGSGTHSKEKWLWKQAGYDASKLRNESWYLESGSGMATTLTVANEKEAYTLADLGTYLKFYKDGKIKLETLVSQGKDLLNVYSAIAVNPNLNLSKKHTDEITFIKYLISDEGQQVIGNYGVSTYGAPLFYPAVEILRTKSDPVIYGWINELAFFNNTECPSQYRTSDSGLTFYAS
jgi:tungstate transport system substrate-binding protein